EEEFSYAWDETAKQVQDFLSFLKNVVPVHVSNIKAVHSLVETALKLEEFIRMDETILEEEKEELKKNAEPLFYAARDLSMTTNYHRLGDNKESFTMDVIKDSAKRL